MRHYIITYALSTYGHPSLKQTLFKTFSRKNREWAVGYGVEIAEGPTKLIRDNYYGPVELWPVFDQRGWLESYIKAISISRMPLETRFTGVEGMLQILAR